MKGLRVQVKKNWNFDSGREAICLTEIFHHRSLFWVVIQWLDSSFVAPNQESDHGIQIFQVAGLIAMEGK